MNVLIITTLAFAGPIMPQTTEDVIVPTVTNHVALAAFNGPRTALAMGAGDLLGYELFVVDADALAE